jgi:phage gp29-like protein
MTNFNDTAKQVDPMRGPLSGQIATRLAAGDMTSFFGLLPNPDPVLRTMGRSISAYHNLLADPLVMGARRRRIAAVVAMERGFHPDRSRNTPERVLNACDEMLARLDVQRLVRDFMDGAFFGYRVSEVMWGSNQVGIIPLDVIAKPCEWFGFEPENSELRFKSPSCMTGVAVPERKFIVVGKARSWDNPYGEPDLAACFWPVTFKRAGFKFWMTFTEKYGMPWAVGKLPRTATQTEHDDLADKLQAMVRDAVATVPDDSSVELLNMKGDFNADLYERLMMFCRGEISIALLGNNQSVEAQSNLASAQAAHKVEAWLRDADAEMVSAGFNQLA